MTKGTEYVEKGIKNYPQKVKEQKIKFLQKQAKQLGFNLSPMVT